MTLPPISLLPNVNMRASALFRVRVSQLLGGRVGLAAVAERLGIDVNVTYVAAIPCDKARVALTRYFGIGLQPRAATTTTKVISLAVARDQRIAMRSRVATLDATMHDDQIAIGALLWALAETARIPVASEGPIGTSARPAHRRIATRAHANEPLAQSAALAQQLVTGLPNAHEGRRLIVNALRAMALALIWRIDLRAVFLEFLTIGAQEGEPALHALLTQLSQRGGIDFCDQPDLQRYAATHYALTAALTLPPPEDIIANNWVSVCQLADQIAMWSLRDQRMRI
jgi:hypothetical protein